LRQVYVHGCENLTVMQITAAKLKNVYKLLKLLPPTPTLRNFFDGR